MKNQAYQTLTSYFAYESSFLQKVSCEPSPLQAEHSLASRHYVSAQTWYGSWLRIDLLRE